ncbi:MAG: enoyl-CoA hydratase/isomerase family protein [Myxococcales bacterium]|nr:enoyl-CoA hydratase/isomerase family protein [Myxococcales bacterium]
MTEIGRWGDVTAVCGDDHVAVVEMHRPPNNFFDQKLISELADAFEACDADDACRSLLLCSEGKHFCAGANFATRGGGLATDSGRHLYEEAVRLFSTRKPVVAAVQGAAVGGGLGLSLMADFRVASEDARFSANFARLGIHHGFGMTVTLPAVVGQQKCMELLYLGRRLRATDAWDIGLCDRVVAPGELRERAHGMAAEIASSAPLAVESIRETFRGDLAERIAVATARERQEQERLQRSADFAEGVRAMSERRPPRFTRS